MLEDILVPIFICVILPVAIVWIVMFTRQQEVKRKTEVMLKAIEAGVPVDTNLLSADKKKTNKSIKQDLLEKLNAACITSLMGLAFLIFATIRYFNPGFGGGNFFFGDFLFPAGGVLLAVGIGLFASYFAGKKMLAKEIEAEEKALQQ
jgi:multisubunit Na+/H+ antiporter MnhG subunit